MIRSHEINYRSRLANISINSKNLRILPDVDKANDWASACEGNNTSFIGLGKCSNTKKGKKRYQRSW